MPRPLLVRYYDYKSDVVTCARLAQSVERKALNLVVVGSSPTLGDALVV